VKIDIRKKVVELEQVDLTRVVFNGEQRKKHNDIRKWEKDIINEQ
jgi:hypothetical protein